jgi:hypothetical protein
MDSQFKSAENPQIDHNRFIVAGECSKLPQTEIQANYARASAAALHVSQLWRPL